MAVRHGGDEPLAAVSTTVAAGHVGGRAGFVDEHETAGREAGLVVLPAGAGGGYVVARLLGGVRCLFF